MAALAEVVEAGLLVCGGHVIIRLGRVGVISDEGRVYGTGFVPHFKVNLVFLPDLLLHCYKIYSKVILFFFFEKKCSALLAE